MPNRTHTPPPIERPNFVPRPMAHRRDQQVEELAPLNPAQRIIAKFGGPSALVKAFARVGHKVVLSQVYRWTIPTERGGANGIIPSKHHAALFAAARVEGIVIVPTDFDPRHDIDF